MIKVLIVDDEVLIRIGLKSSIDWQGNGFSIVGEASNGLQALEIIKSNTIDIVITDIRMPGMDGIELTKQLKTLHPNIKVIILSYFDDFKYVKDAMKYGAMDYVLKMTMEPQDLLDIVIKAKEEIAGLRNYQISTASNPEKTDSFFEETFLSNLVNGTSLEGMDLVHKQRVADIGVIEKDLVLIVVRYGNYSYITRNYSNNEKELLKNSIHSIIKEVFKDLNKKAISSAFSQNEFVLIMNVDKKSHSINVHDLTYSYISKISVSIEKFCNVKPLIAVSNLFNSFSQINTIYNATMLLFKYRIYGNGEIFYYQDYSSFATSKNEYDIKRFLNELTTIIKTNDSSAVKELFLGMRNELIQKHIDTEYMQKIFLYILRHLEQVLFEIGYSEDKALSSISEQDKKFEYCETVSDYIDFLSNLSLLISNEIYNYKMSKCGQYVKKTIIYIRNNYRNNISLHQVSEHVNLTPSYLSRIFKEETEENFVEFLNRIRIEQAKTELLSSGLKTYEIAKNVGFDNSKHFLHIFKRYTGMTPLEFRTQGVKK